MSREDVEFRTVDGLFLRGWLYPAAQRGPALIMTQGVRSLHFNGQTYEMFSSLVL
jgi:hypothetical protein